MEVVNNRVAIVSNATDLIGAAISSRLAQKGATVICSGTDQDSVDSLVARIKSEGGQAIGLVMDSTDPAQVKASVARVVADYGRVDILVNNVDAPNGAAIREISDDQWQDGININLNPIFYFCREVLPVMCENKYGRIINLSSLEYIGLPGISNYAAAKSAIFGLTRSLALESAKDDVTVNCVAKGDIKSAAMSDEDCEKMAKRIPVQKMGTADDVARTVGFFASDTSKYVTGQTFFVCGGKSAYFSMSI
ncbi:BhsC: 2-[hydroxy(Phenyl)methyl]-succinyl-CoA DH, subunit [Desulfosarcina variabilis str. Montpellier]|uniref:SDR family NAD(P)-dependent oxidoreductase n=1 Tax=Desulfosarcina variabilis TaxID=2300 RepID=UPI003AFA8F65